MTLSIITTTRGNKGGISLITSRGSAHTISDGHRHSRLRVAKLAWQDHMPRPAGYVP